MIESQSWMMVEPLDLAFIIFFHHHTYNYQFATNLLVYGNLQRFWWS